jgi:GT2 family glycosyltransferase
VLHRPADPAGMLDHATALRNGALEVEILERLAFSEEFAGLLETKFAELSREYAFWIRHNDKFNENDFQAIRQHLGTFAQTPVISLITTSGIVRPEHLRAMLDSIIEQIYPYWELCIADSTDAGESAHTILGDYARRDSRIKPVRGNWKGSAAMALNAALAQAIGAYVAVLGEADVLASHALYMIVETLNRHPDAQLIYSDEDKIDETGHRVDPFFKSHWNPDLFYSINFLGGLSVWKRPQYRGANVFRPSCEDGHVYDFLLGLLADVPDEHILHVPHVLSHRQVENLGPDHEARREKAEAAAERRALEEHLQKRGILATVLPAPRVPRGRRVVYPVSDPAPTVSLIIPTHDKVGLLRSCVTGLLEAADYEPIEVIIVDHESQQVETKDWLRRIGQHPQVRVLEYRGAFSWSAVNNMAAQHVRGTVLGFLNDDILMIHDGWLREMVGHALRPEVGIVGAKLLYPNETIQHAGLVLGINGNAMHVCRGMPSDSPTNHYRLQLVQNYAVVTGACMVMRREVLEHVGGFDEALPVLYNDVDFCLRVRSKGYRILWTPYAELYHYESATLLSPREDEKLVREHDELAYMRRCWGDRFLIDPFYNPNLTGQTDDCSLAPRSTVRKPWTEFLRDQEQPISASGLADSQPQSASTFHLEQ